MFTIEVSQFVYGVFFFVYLLNLFKRFMFCFQLFITCLDICVYQMLTFLLIDVMANQWWLIGRILQLCILGSTYL